MIRRRWGRGSRATAGVDVIVYTRVGCGLCRRAEELVRREAGRASIRIVDVDADPALRDRYDVRVPVVTVDGVEVAQLEVMAGEVGAAVRAAARGAARRGPDAAGDDHGPRLRA